jgi:hypothetical protein
MSAELALDATQLADPPPVENSARKLSSHSWWGNYTGNNKGDIQSLDNTSLALCRSSNAEKESAKPLSPANPDEALLITSTGGGCVRAARLLAAAAAAASMNALSAGVEDNAGSNCAQPPIFMEGEKMFWGGGCYVHGTGHTRQSSNVARHEAADASQLSP